MAKEERQISRNAVASERNFFLKLKAKGEEITPLITENYSCSNYPISWAFSTKSRDSLKTDIS